MLLADQKSGDIMEESWLEEPTEYDYAVLFPLVRILVKALRDFVPGDLQNGKTAPSTNPSPHGQDSPMPAE
jgi:hypothetical protein